ncbi:MAG: ATP-binding protein [Bacteroidales bacterium]|nr:ATP-binding protein [Bacteroidales bacterium]
MKRIVITGPESTGKSWLAKNLAKHYQTIWVPEYARDYIAHLNRPYQQHDILTIAQQQLKNEEKMLTKADRYLFADTSVLVAKIWSDFVFGQCDPWIEQKIDEHRYDLYLLCYIDTPWEYDPQREHPHARGELFQLYKQELLSRNLPYKIITGIHQNRLENAIKAIDEYFRK